METFKQKEFPKLNIPPNTPLYVALRQNGVIGIFAYQGHAHIKNAIQERLIKNPDIQKAWPEEGNMRRAEAHNLSNIVANNYVWFIENKINALKQDPAQQ